MLMADSFEILDRQSLESKAYKVGSFWDRLQYDIGGHNGSEYQPFACARRKKNLETVHGAVAVAVILWKENQLQEMKETDSATELSVLGVAMM